MTKLFSFLIFLTISFIDASRRIFNGHVAKEGDVPWHAGLINNTGHIMCGGTIVSSDVIVTSGECIKRFHRQAGISVAVDTYNKNQIKKTYKIAHTLFYNDGTIKSYFGLVRVNEDIVYSEKIYPVNLPKHKLHEGDGPMYVVGWGDTTANGDPSDDLMISGNNFVLKAGKELPGLVKVVGVSTNPSWACLGDEGSGLVWNGRLVGIFAYAPFDCSHTSARVYVDVFTFERFIVDYIYENYEE